MKNRSIILSMPEHEGSLNPFYILRETYSENIPLWAVRFTESIATVEYMGPNGIEKVPSPDFSYFLFEETTNLALDMDLDETPKKSAVEVQNLVERKRIDPEDEIDIYSLSKKEYIAFIELLKKSAEQKLISLADYLALIGTIQAIPLAFLTGRTDGIFSEAFANFGEDQKTKPKHITIANYYPKWGLDTRGQVLRKAQRLFTDGGRVIIPFKAERGFLNGLVDPGGKGKFARFSFDEISQNIDVKLIVAGKVDPEKQILPMLCPKEMREEV